MSSPFVLAAPTSQPTWIPISEPPGNFQPVSDGSTSIIVGGYGVGGYGLGGYGNNNIVTQIFTQWTPVVD